MKVDWDELNRLQGSDDPNNWMLFARILDKAWPSILAEREAAQRLRDAADEARSWMTMPKAEGTLKPTLANVGANQRRIVAELQSALAAFDKEAA